MAASTSTAANPDSCNYPFDVFINHRGPDVKKTFASYLYRRLRLHTLKVFLDQQELQKGDYLTSQIQEAITTASVHVAIYSPRYAESSWCLNELLLMLETGKTIIPVFYHVRPAELRWTYDPEKNGQYAVSLQNLAEKKTYDPETQQYKSRYDSKTIENWRNSLSRVADIIGFDLEVYNGDEGELLEQVVERVLKAVTKTPIHVAKHATGLDEKVKDFENEVLLQQQHSGKPMVLGIVGLGGVGKTTLAKELFNRKSSSYCRSCYLPDIREQVSKGALMLLQQNLLHSLTGSYSQIKSVDEGIETLKKHLSFSQVLIVLDDVDQVDHIDALLPDQTVLCSDSLILITSRNRDILTNSGVEDRSIYKLTGLDKHYSRELFCSHAFGQPYSLSGFESLVDRFLETCDGLPLSLKVFGALLRGQKQSHWEGQLNKLQQILPTEIKERLKISYEALDEQEQQIFLDISCIFIGKYRDNIINIWDGSHWNGSLGFQNLQNRCLVEVDRWNHIHMHDHLRDLGREIADASGLIFRAENIDDLLRQMQSSSVLRELRGICMVRTKGDDKHAYLRSKMSWHRGILQLRDSETALLEPILRRVHSPNLAWLRWYKCPYSSLPSWIPMKNLRILKVQGDELKSLWEDEWQAPSQLRCLVIHGVLSSIPNSIGKLKYLGRIFIRSPELLSLPREFGHLWALKSLVLMKCSKVQSLPDSLGYLSNLQKIELSGFHNLESLPNSFGNLTNLQWIELSRCYSLERLPDSFQNLIKLKYLKLCGCSNLAISSEALANISTLEHIDLSDCAKIDALPLQVAHQRSLQKLYLQGTNLEEIPSAIGELSDLEVLFVGSPSLDRLPPSLGNLRNLKKLWLESCKKLNCLPASGRMFARLTELTVLNCPFREFPFKPLETSSNLASSCEECMPRLQFLKISGTEISEVSFARCVCQSLQRLYIYDCKDLEEVGTLPNTLTELKLIRCDNLRKIEGLSGLAKLQMLDISGCKKVEMLPSTETLVSLEGLYVHGCVALKSVQGLAQLAKLREIDVRGCSELEELPSVAHLRSWQLVLSNCVKLKTISGLAALTKLRRLNVAGCSQLEDLPGIEQLRSLEQLEVYGCAKLKSLRGLSQLTNLRILNVGRCSHLEGLAGVEHLMSLEKLHASSCVSMKSITGLAQLTKLRTLAVAACSELEELSGIDQSRSLEVLWAWGCVKLKNLRGLGNLTKLRKLNVGECHELEELEGIEHCRSLKNLCASGCPKLQWGGGVVDLLHERLKKGFII